MLISPRLFVHFNPNEELVLSCDASPFGVGAVLAHQVEDDVQNVSSREKLFTN